MTGISTQTSENAKNNKVVSSSSAYIICEHLMSSKLKGVLLNWKSGRSAERIRDLKDLGHLAVLTFDAHSLPEDKLYELFLHRLEKTKFVGGILSGTLDYPRAAINIPEEGRYVFAIEGKNSENGVIYVPRTNRHALVDLVEGYENRQNISHGTDLALFASPQYAKIFGLAN